jgi:hypothetical protein
MLAFSFIDMMHASMHYHAVGDDRRFPLAAIINAVGDEVRWRMCVVRLCGHAVALQHFSTSVRGLTAPQSRWFRAPLTSMVLNVIEHTGSACMCTTWATSIVTRSS